MNFPLKCRNQYLYTPKERVETAIFGPETAFFGVFRQQRNKVAQAEADAPVNLISIIPIGEK